MLVLRAVSDALRRCACLENVFPVTVPLSGRHLVRAMSFL